MIEDLSTRIATDAQVSSASSADPEVYQAALKIMGRSDSGGQRRTGKDVQGR